MPGDIYSMGVTFARLCVEAGVRKDFTEEIEATLSKVLYRFAAFDSRRWIQFLLDILPRLDDVDFAKLPPLEQRMLQMIPGDPWCPRDFLRTTVFLYNQEEDRCLIRKG